MRRAAAVDVDAAHIAQLAGHRFECYRPQIAEEERRRDHSHIPIRSSEPRNLVGQAAVERHAIRMTDRQKAARARHPVYAGSEPECAGVRDSLWPVTRSRIS